VNGHLSALMNRMTGPTTTQFRWTPFPTPASYYKEQGDAEWCVVDDCDEDATGEVNGLLVCDEHKSDAEGGELTVIELIETL
jgi:hypothetical protein